MKRKTLFSTMLVMAVLLFSAVSVLAESTEMTLTPGETWYSSEAKGSAAVNPNYQSATAGDIISYTSGNYLTLLKNRVSYAYVKFDLTGITENNLQSAVLNVNYNAIKLKSTLKIESIAEAAYNTAFPLTGTKTLPEVETNAVYTSETLSTTTTAGTITTDIYEYITTKLAEGKSAIYLRISYNDGGTGANNGIQFNGATLEVVKELIYHTVTFVDYDGTVIDTQTVKEGTSVTAPENPSREGYTFTGWDVDFSNVTSDLTVTAQYEWNYVASGTCGDNLTWSLDNGGTLTISGSGEMTHLYSSSSFPWYSNRSSIKSVVIENGVTSISDYAFHNYDSLTSVTIGNGVTSIGYSAFGYCIRLDVVHISSMESWLGISFVGCYANPLYYAKKLYLNGELVTELVIPESVTKINHCAFYNCDSLTSVTIGNGVTSIGGNAFKYCTGLTSVTIPDSVTSIGGSAFEYCTGLTSVIIPDSVTSIGYSAFEYCTGLTSVTIPDSVTSIGGNAFYGTGYYNNQSNWENNVLYIGKYLVNANSSISGSCKIKEGTLYIGDRAFYNCDSLTSVTIPDSVTSIGNSAFEYCTGLTSVTIGNGVTSIGNSAFEYCTGLTSVIIPDSVTSIGDSAFWGCHSLTSVTVTENNENYSSQDGMLFNKDKTTLIFCPTGKSGSCEIPNSVTNIGVSAFAYCYLLTSIVIPDSVTSIGGNAFKYCTGLTSVTIPDSVTSIGGYTFELCTGLTSVTIPDSVTSIGSSAFFYCESLTDVYYGGTEEQWNAVSIGSGNEYLTGATIHFAEEIPEEPEYVASGTCGENLTWTLDSEGTLTISGTGEMTNWAYSSDVSWHSNRELITNVVIDYGVTSIGDKAFYPCENLTSVAIPDSVTSIGIWAFYDCVALRSVTIPDGVLKISEKAFYNCSGLTTVSIPDSVNYIGKEAFYSCDGLTAVYITDLAAWCNIDFETALANPLYYANNLYVNDTAVFELKIPDGVTEIKKDTFLNEQNFTSITFPDSVTTIGYEAFYNCDSVTQITIPVSVTSIGAYAFCDCSYLTDVYYEGTQEQWNSLSIGLDNQSLTNATIHFAEVEPEFVASGACGDNLTWTLDDEGVLNINGSGDMYDFSDGTPWAMWEESIKSVNIAEGVTYIGEWAFSDCRNLVDLTIPGTVTEIGSCAFTNCTALQSVTIPYGVETIGSIAFNACTSLKELTISDSVKIIESEAFSWCVALTDVTIGGNVTSIGGAAFSDCTGLTAVSIPCSVTDIDDSAFNNCESLTDVYYSGAKSQWNKIVIGEENEPLTSATIHFAEEPDYTLGENLTWELSEDGVLTISGTGEMPDYVYAYDSPWFSRVSEIKKVIISEGVTKIGKYCFDLHANIESVSIADSVTVIGNHAFSFCSGLTEINIPDGVTVIDEYTFDNCKTLEKIEIGSGVTTIKGMAFSNCSALTTVTIPKTVTEIEDYAFFYATAITDVYYKGSSSMWETISIGDSNTSLTNATIHFAEEDEPADDGNSGVSGGGFKDPDIVTGSDGFNRYYIDGEIQTKWQVTPSGYKYYFSTSVAKYGAATIGTGIKIAGVYYDFDTDGRLIESYDEEGNPVHYCNPDEGAIYTVIYDAQGGTPSVAGKRRRISANADLSVTAEKENCKFLGWGLTKFATEPITSCTVTGDMTLYAIYEQVYVVMCEDGYYRYYVDGTACTGWQITPDGYKYYFSSGSSKYGAAMVGKNQKVGGSYYDFAEDGKLIDSYDNDGNPVYFKHLEGFVSDSQGNTKFYKDNKFVIDWQYIDGYKYYFSKSTGNMLTGYTRVGSVYYSFNQDGTWNGYFQTPKTEEECLYSDLLTKDEDGKYRYYVDGEAYKGWKVLKGDTGYYKYYFSKSDGGALTVYGVKVGSEYLDFSPTGTLITVTRDENGNAVMSDYILSFEQGAKNGVLLDDDGCYRYYIDGEYQIGWQTVDGYKYYFKTKDGAGITTKNYKLGSFWYDFTPDGKFLAKKKTPDTRFVVNLMPGEGATGNEIITGVVLNTEYTLPENTFEKENYRFAGWTDGNEIFRPGKIILVNGDKQFTAVWEYILKDFVFTFTYLEESITISTKEGESVVLPENTFAKEGYEFDGWTDGENTYLSGSSITVTGNMSFTPLWKYIPKDVTLTFKDKDAEPYVITVKEGHKMRLGDGIFEREGCRFIGWMNDIYIYFPEDEITILEDMVFTAVWQKVTEVRTPITAEFIQPANLGTSFDSEFTGDNPYLSLYDEDNDYTNTEYPLETDTVIVINGYNAGVISENESTYYGGLTNATDLGLIYAPNQGEVVLVDKDDDGKYDVIEVTAYETTVVTEVYGANKKIATWYTPSIDLTNAVDGKEGYSYELTKNGQKMEISELKENDILSVAVSPDKKNYKILVSDTKVEGVVVSAYKPSGLSVDEYIWTINDTEYRISNFADRDGSLSFTVSEIIAGDEGVAYLDTFGKIALFEKEPRVKPEECSFIVGAAPYTSSNSTHYEAEFLNADGSITVCDFADYVDVTVGETYQGRASSEDVYNTYIVPNALYAADGTLTWIFENDATYYSDADCTSVVYENGDYVTIPLMERYAGRMVSYETDENGEITKIVFSQLTSLGNIENGLFCDAVFEKLEYIEASKCFGGYAEINEGTVIFNLPITSSSKETDFEILTLSDLQDGYSYDICVLQHDDATYSAGVIVITKERIPGVDVEVSWDECFAVVTKVMTAKDADSYDVVQITFIQGGEENTLWTTPELYESAKSITKGSLFEYSLDEDGRINKIDFANLGNGAYPLPTAGYVAEFGAEPSAYTDETGYAEGFVTAKVASRRIQIKDEATLVADIRNGTNSAAYRHSLDSANVYIIDLTKTNITPEIAAFGDIQATYVDADGMISDTDRDTYVLIKYVKGVATDVVVYKGYAKVNNILQ